MEITVLTENTKINDDLICEHGLSLFVKTSCSKFLVDSGQTDALIYNAKKLDVDLSDLDYIFLSHGHYDHCGGVVSLKSISKNSFVYIRDCSFKNYHDNTGKYIGINPEIMNLDNLNLVYGSCEIDNNISVFTDVTGREYFPFTNQRLLVTENGKTIQDDFKHEQYVVLKENDKYVLFSGCAHNGIINIVDEFKDVYNRTPDFVISGFHLKIDGEYTSEEIEIIKKTAEKLNTYNTIYYTGHCTSQPAIDIMRPILGNKLKVLSTGLKFTI